MENKEQKLNTFRPKNAQKTVLDEMKKGHVLRHFIASRMVDSRFYLINNNGELIDVNGLVGRNLIKSGLLEFIGQTGKNKDYKLINSNGQATDNG